jgi:hypothetical protein
VAAAVPAAVVPADPAVVAGAAVVAGGAVVAVEPTVVSDFESLPQAARNAAIAAAPPASIALRETPKPKMPGSTGGMLSSWWYRTGASGSSIF